MTDTTAKIREILDALWDQAEASLSQSRSKKYDVDNAMGKIALLDAERPSVPMAMLKACNRMRFDYDADTEFRELELGKIADRYGFGVTEE